MTPSLRSAVRQALGPMTSDSKCDEVARAVLGASQDHAHAASDALEGEHLRLAMNAAKAAWPVIEQLIQKQYNVETWGLRGRLAAINAALAYSSASPNAGESLRDEQKKTDPA